MSAKESTSWEKYLVNDPHWYLTNMFRTAISHFIPVTEMPKGEVGWIPTLYVANLQLTAVLGKELLKDRMDGL